jgi:hypothetical protein
MSSPSALDAAYAALKARALVRATVYAVYADPNATEAAIADAAAALADADAALDAAYADLGDADADAAALARETNRL